MALLSESLRNGSQSARDNCTRIGFLMLERAAISAGHFYSLPRTPIHTYTSCALTRRAY